MFDQCIWGEQANGTAFAITLRAAPNLDATNLVVGQARSTLPPSFTPVSRHSPLQLRRPPAVLAPSMLPRVPALQSIRRLLNLLTPLCAKHAREVLREAGHLPAPAGFFGVCQRAAAAAAAQVVGGLDVVRALAGLPTVKANGDSGYVKCALPAPYFSSSESLIHI